VYSEQEYSIAEGQDAKLPGMSHGPVYSTAGILTIGAKYRFVFDSMIGFFSYETTSTSEDYSQSRGLIYTVSKDTKAHSTLIFFTPAVRFQNTDRKAFQIGVAGVYVFGDTDVSFPIPMCSWFYKF
jgi:hypothetical protein